jgi:hypothetical protein
MHELPTSLYINILQLQIKIYPDFRSANMFNNFTLVALKRNDYHTFGQVVELHVLKAATNLPICE